MGRMRDLGRSVENPLPPRAAAGRLLGGVCARWSEVLGVDVTLLRLAALLLGLAWGVGVVLYIALWLLMPAPETRRPPTLGDSVRDNAERFTDDLRSASQRLADAWRRTERASWPRPLGRRWLGLGLAAAGVTIFLASVGAFGWLTPVRALGLGLAVAGATVALTVGRQR
ncbi:MAG TPA: PspC domain-containing protein [Sandaracinaceae bacterium LLY-WYZ-13_1]|nr:PspC domain-containing protein [Sandaracinaceae bacterium LLY-WYZ-13_1]